MAKRRTIVLAAAAIVIFAAAVPALFPQKKWKIEYTYSDEAYCNPLTGYAPSADYYEAALPESLVYIDVTWAQWEPEEGVYAWDQVAEDNYLKEWKSMGKHGVLRFVCDMPGDEAHRDIPEWLYEQTEDGAAYEISYGRGYCPDYSNPVFIEKHERALKALGEKCSEDGFIAYVELGSLGHWGEWHIKEEEGLPEMPDEEICAQYVRQYEQAFPNARMMMRRNYAVGMEKGFGVFNDMTGMEEDTREWLDWMENGESCQGDLRCQPVEKIWNQAPVGGEFTSSLPMEEMLGSRLEKTLSLIRESHMTFIGPKCPVKEEALTDGAEAVRSSLGYRIWIKSMTVKESRFSDTLEICLVWRNDGAAPMYFDWSVVLYVRNSPDQEYQTQKTGLSLSELLPGKEIQTVTDMPWKRAEKEQITIGIGIIDPDTGKPCVRLAMEGEYTDGIQILSDGTCFAE